MTPAFRVALERLVLLSAATLYAAGLAALAAFVSGWVALAAGLGGIAVALVVTVELERSPERREQTRQDVVRRARAARETDE